MFNQEEARDLLRRANVFFDESDGDDPKWTQTICLNDAFEWALADCEYVPDEDLPEVAELFWRYGWCGILYWATQKRDHFIEFEDVKRFVKFVQEEEKIRKNQPSSSKRAYLKHIYTLGERDDAKEKSEWMRCLNSILNRASLLFDLAKRNFFQILFILTILSFLIGHILIWLS